MCGVAGVFMLDGRSADLADVVGMNAMQTHRGPDDEGAHMDGPLGLGHRRLSILDPTPTGHQPMSYADERYWIVFNGEVYNFMELRDELKGLGHVFVSDTDTEVVLAAYAQWGEACQERFNGMWGLAIWDAKDKRLFLSRDRFGVKPLHYFMDGKRFAFASELKGFLGLSWFPCEFDEGVMALGFIHPYDVDASEVCFLKGVRRLRPGHSLTLMPDGHMKIKRWWNTLDHIPAPGTTNLEIMAREFRELFLDACRLRLRSDVPLGTALSGGLDSSAVQCALAYLCRDGEDVARLPADHLKAFIGGFKGTSQDERDYALDVVAHTGAEGIIAEIDPLSLAKDMENIVFSSEALLTNPMPGSFIYRTMRENGVVVSLDGHGGDELFAGYHHYAELAIQASQGDPLLNQELRLLHRGMISEGWEGALPCKVNFPHYLKVAPSRVTYPEREADQKRIDALDPINRALYQDFHYGSLPLILQNFDRASMAHGVEIRAPLMDWRVVTHAFSLPWNAKLGGGFAKYVMRLGLRDIMPPRIVMRKTKLGLTSPLAQWLTGPLKPFVMDLLADRDFLDSSMWDGPGVKAAAEDLLDQNDGGSLRTVWPFLHATMLMRTFKTRRPNV